MSYPIVFFCLKIATVVMLLNFKFLDAVEARYNDVGGIFASIMLSLPSIVYAIAIAVLNNLYHQLATFLTEWGKLLAWYPCDLWSPIFYMVSL